MSGGSRSREATRKDRANSVTPTERFPAAPKAGVEFATMPFPEMPQPR